MLFVSFLLQNELTWLGSFWHDTQHKKMARYGVGMMCVLWDIFLLLQVVLEVLRFMITAFYFSITLVTVCTNHKNTVLSWDDAV